MTAVVRICAGNGSRLRLFGMVIPSLSFRPGAGSRWSPGRDPAPEPRRATHRRRPGTRPTSSHRYPPPPTQWGHPVEWSPPVRNQPCLPEVVSQAEFSEVRVDDLQRSDLRPVASRQLVRPRSHGTGRPLCPARPRTPSVPCPSLSRLSCLTPNSRAPGAQLHMVGSRFKVRSLRPGFA